MACIILRNQKGDERRVGDNENYTLRMGEAIVGTEYDCGPQYASDGPDVKEHLAENSIQWGDAIAWVTKRLGVKQCAPCKARQEILNNVNEVGWKETFRQIKGTL
jgi:hypothetical protein